MSRELWIFNHYARTNEDTGGARHFEMARHLVERGWRVTIFASGVTHRTGNVLVPLNQSRLIRLIDGVRFVWLRTSPYSGNGFARWKNMYQFYLEAVKKEQVVDLGEPDVVLGSSVHPLAGLAALKVARRFKVPFVFEVRDLWPQTLIDMGKISRYGAFSFVLKRLESFLYRRASRIISVLPGAADYIKNYKVSSEKIEWISNGVDLSAYIPIDCRLSSNENFTIMYLGSLGEANAVHTMLDAMKLVSLENRNVQLHLVGAGPLRDELISYAKKYKLLDRSVFFIEAVPRSEVPRVAAEADAFIITVKDVPGLYRYGISMNKIFDYMAAGRPTIIAVNAFNNPIIESGGGVSVPPDDPQKLADAIINLSVSSPADRAVMGQAARDHVREFYTYGYLADKLEGVLLSALKNFEERKQ